MAFRAGANVDLQNDKGDTALMLAEKAGNKANAEALLAVSSEL